MTRNDRRYQSALQRFSSGLVASLLTLAMSGAIAHAQGEANEDKAGRAMLNVRGGPAFGIVNADGDVRFLGGVGLDLGIAVSPGYNLYLVLTPQIDLRENFYNVMVPLGLQYDIRIARGLYIYPRVSMGYSVMISSSSVDLGPLHLSASEITHGGVGIPELGIKYIADRHFNIGFEPVSVPIFFTDNSYAAWYRVNLFLGGTF